MKREYDRHLKPGHLINCKPGELYNLADDPGESRNLGKEHPEIVQALHEIASDFQAAVKAGKLPGSRFRSLLLRLRRKQK
jgi:arylsulfatase A-like enzyme